MDRSGTGRGSKDGRRLLVLVVSQRYLLVGSALLPVPTPKFGWQVAVREELFFAGCYRVLKDGDGRGTCGGVVTI